VEEKLYTLVGTPLYLAPEIVKFEGYDFSSDFWQIGLCLYELLCRKQPFEQSKNVFESIV
jgi:serine/threonine protein kinase